MLLARTTIIHNAKEKKCFVMFMQRIIFNYIYVHYIELSQLELPSDSFISLSSDKDGHHGSRPGSINVRLGLVGRFFLAQQKIFLTFLYPKFIVLFVCFCLNGQCQRRMSKHVGIQVHILSNLGRATTRLAINWFFYDQQESGGIRTFLIPKVMPTGTKKTYRRSSPNADFGT